MLSNFVIRLKNSKLLRLHNVESNLCRNVTGRQLIHSSAKRYLGIGHFACNSSVPFVRNKPQDLNYINSRLLHGSTILNSEFQDYGDEPPPQKPPKGGSRGGSSSNDDYTSQHSLPATVVVPEEWSNLPLVAINRTPLFPRFIKIVEVS